MRPRLPIFYSTKGAEWRPDGRLLSALTSSAHGIDPQKIVSKYLGMPISVDEVTELSYDNPCMPVCVFTYMLTSGLIVS